MPQPQKIKSGSAHSIEKWHVAYTSSNAERKVQSKLEKLGFESYLPMHIVERNWSDRKKRLVVPLFPNYIFVKTSPNKRIETFTIREIVRYVSFGGAPVSVKDTIINSIKTILMENREVNVIENNISIGSPIKIINGPFTGMEGILLSMNGNTRFVLKIDSLQKAISINIPSSDVVPLYSDTDHQNVAIYL